MKPMTSFLFSIALLFATGQAALAEKADAPASIDGTTLVNADQLIELVESNDDLVVVDSRKVSDFEKGHIPDSINLPNTETNSDSLAQLLPSKASPVLFYCNGAKCGRSVEACQIAVAEGYTKVYWFRGGIQEWEAKGYPVDR